MKTGWKIAALVLIVLLSPRMATADAFRLHRTTKEATGERVALRASTEATADAATEDRHLRGIPKRSWGIPRRWKLTIRRLTGGDVETARTTVPQQHLELVGGKRRAEQKTLGEITPQGP